MWILLRPCCAKPPLVATFHMYIHLPFTSPIFVGYLGTVEPEPSWCTPCRWAWRTACRRLGRICQLKARCKTLSIGIVHHLRTPICGLCIVRYVSRQRAICCSGRIGGALHGMQEQPKLSKLHNRNDHGGQFRCLPLQGCSFVPST